MIRRNRIAVAVAGGLAAVLALVVWNPGAVGVRDASTARTGPVDAAARAGYPDAPAAPAATTPAGRTAPRPAAPETAAPRPDVPGAARQPAATRSGAPEPAAAPAEAPPVTLVAKSVPKMGEVVPDGAGRTLYRFDKDSLDRRDPPAGPPRTA
ncbi:hypothetical protein [Saccharothrix australiensis]|uniref:Uncharacterized protein n=1 Tax=Saccharothrix australiensis TaxID=2072 RepID=A0A495W522_9PSEU|nr:hypothetical protein [Saccharothrix australiensis]RKT56766.1 hypothetical protein C8E97_5477 [Saccharothrix australiensis]